MCYGHINQVRDIHVSDMCPFGYQTDACSGVSDMLALGLIRQVSVHTYQSGVRPFVVSYRCLFDLLDRCPFGRFRQVSIRTYQIGVCSDVLDRCQ